MWRWVAAVCASLLLVACTAGDERGGSSHHQMPSAHTAEHQTHVTGHVPSCFRPKTTAILGDRQLRVRGSIRSPMRLSMPVRSILTVQSFGDCAREVNTGPQNGRMRTTGTKYASDVRTTTFLAARAGKVRLVVAMPMCAQMDRSTGSTCVGGVILLATVLIDVESHAGS